MDANDVEKKGSDCCVTEFSTHLLADATSGGNQCQRADNEHGDLKFPHKRASRIKHDGIFVKSFHELVRRPLLDCTQVDRTPGKPNPEPRKGRLCSPRLLPNFGFGRFQGNDFEALWVVQQKHSLNAAELPAGNELEQLLCLLKVKSHLGIRGPDLAVAEVEPFS